jgi:hypothetical protein
VLRKDGRQANDMKVWVGIETDDESYANIGVFDSEDIADECIEACKRAEPERYDDD